MNFERFEIFSFHTTSLDGIHIRRMTDEISKSKSSCWGSIPM